MSLLNRRRVEYLVVGGYAVAFYGYPRATGGLDVWISVHPDNIARLVEALREFGFGGDDMRPSLFTKPGAIIRLGVPPVRIEILTRLSGVAFDVCYPDRIEGDLDGELVQFVDLDTLKQNKRTAGRYRDLIDLENLP